MAEKKRVTVMVDGMATAPGAEDPFNFGTGFQMSAAPPLPPSSDENAPAQEVTGYQSGRKSIVAGVGASDLLQMHRKSLAQLVRDDGNNSNGGAPVDMTAFSGVTLSRRHRATVAEYDEGKVDGQHETLSGFSFGSAE